MRVRHKRNRLVATALALLAGGIGSGCNRTPRAPVVVFLDGSGGLGFAGQVRQGLRGAGYRGDFDDHRWSTMLLAADHLLVARITLLSAPLADKIARIRQRSPNEPIHMIGLSAGTAVLLDALERLPESVQVDSVVLLSPSVSADRNLTAALRHVRGRLYATTSKEDYVLATLVINADGGTGPTAGRVGFRVPRDLPPDQAKLYEKVISVPWKPAHVGYGWNGGHMRVTNPRFIRSVIAPRLLGREPLPIDRPL